MQADAPKKRVLIAEDNPGLAHVLCFNLEMAGFDVTVANTGSDAWLAAQQGSFDAVVTDHEMPGLTGVELCRQLRTLAAYRRTPILMVTAREMELETRELREELHLAAILAKPYSPGELVELLETTLAAAVE